METSDYLIIGGGIAGISAGARLAALGSLTLLEGEDALAYHSTGRSAAMFEENYGNATIRALNRAGRAYFEAIEGAMTKRGILIVMGDGEEADFVKLLENGYGEISKARALELVPLLRGEKVTRAAYHGESCNLDVDLLVQDYLRKLRAAGGTVVTSARAENIERVDGAWQVTTGAGVFRGRVLVNAAGAWADRVAVMAGAQPLGVQPMRRSVARVPAPEGVDVSRWPMVFSATEDWYAKPDAGQLLVSPADEDPIEAMDAWADDLVLAEGLDRFMQFVDMEVTRVTSNWAGLRSFPPDRTPVVGFDRQVEGFFWVAGQGGYGIQTSPAISQLVAELIGGGDVTLAPDIVAALNPARFSRAPSKG